MQTEFLRPPLTAVALGLLLAACGSDSTGDSGAASQPAPSGSITKATAADTAGDAQAATASAAGAALSAQGVRGDVLLTMMDNATCNNFLNETSAYNGPAYPRADNTVSDAKAQYGLGPSNYLENPDYHWPSSIAIPLDRVCPAFIYQPVKPGTYTFYVSSSDFSRTRPVKLDKGFNGVSLDFPMTVTQDSVTIGNEVPALLNRDARPYPEAIQQILKPEQVRLTLKSGSPYSFRLDETVPFNTPLKEWDNGGAQKVQMMVLPGETNQAKLCWSINTDVVKRLHCAVWEVPAGWKRGAELKQVDQYVVDDRTVYPNESGMRYFRTAVQGD